VQDADEKEMEEDEKVKQDPVLNDVVSSISFTRPCLASAAAVTLRLRKGVDGVVGTCAARLARHNGHGVHHLRVPRV